MKHIIWVRYILMTLCVVVVLMGWVLRDDVDLLLNWMYVMLGLGVGAMVIMSVFSLAQNPKSAVQALLGLGVILVIIGISFALSNGTPLSTPTSYYDNVAELKIADTGLYATYALLVGAVLAILLGETRNAFK
ncbi:hypothetical protein LJB87_01880 [Alistipes sp. OttesenSCG-928-L06]|nr:hypothetical protein [Alistipes sp. OttesenSCG-928-L06]